MLFIYGSLRIGGIETFFVRMAKERSKLGLSTTVLLFSEPEQSNKELLTEMKEYASVLFPKDLFSIPNFISKRLPLISPIKRNSLSKAFDSVDQIHVFDGMHALIGNRFNKVLGKDIPITVGFYHYIKYLWGGRRIPHYERLNRQFIFNYLPKQSLLFFSAGNRELYSKHKKICFDESQVFRLGVVDKKDIEITSDIGKPIKICAVGRLVDFKTYNLFMIDVVKALKERGVLVNFDIYGEGSLKDEIETKIEKLDLGNLVNVKGNLEYSLFDETVSKYDLFIGSGTAIIQAASLGVPSIVGVENMTQSQTYGYFSDVHRHEYNLKSLDLPLFSIQNMIENYILMRASKRLELKRSHLESIEAFTNEACQKSMDALKDIKMPKHAFKFNPWLYQLSRLFDSINMRLNDKHPRRTQFEDFQKVNEKS